MEPYQIDHDTFLMDTPAGAAVISFESEEQSLYGKVRPLRHVSVGKDGQKKMVQWGANNCEPSERAMLIEENHNVGRLLKKRRNMILGSGMMLYKERFEWDETSGKYKRIIDELQMPPQMMEFLEDMHYEDMNRCTAGELLKQGQYFPEFLEKGSGEIASVKLHEALYVRAECDDTDDPGKPLIPNWLICADWSKQRTRNVTAVPNYDPKDKRQTKYIRRFSDEMFGGPYYYAPDWWGSKLWIKLANIIPEFHLANLKNGYLIRYHIRVPKGYFVSIPEGKSIATLTKAEKEEVFKSAEAKKKAFQEQLNSLLVGVKNAGRTLFTTYDLKQVVNGKFPGVEITPIEVDLKDDALLALFDKSNIVATSSQGLHSSLVGIDTQGKLSSGSDIRNALSLYLATDVQEERRIVFGLWNFIGKKNNWFTGEYAGAKFGARDVVIVTTDKDPTGMQPAEPDTTN